MAPFGIPAPALGLRWHSGAWFAGACTLGFLILWLAPLPPLVLGLKIYAPLHTLLEIFAVSVAAAIFAVGWHAQVSRETGVQSLLAAGFLAVALLDTVHLLSFPGMPDWITPSSPEKAIYFYFAARYTAAFSLLILVIPHKPKMLTPATAAIAMTLAAAYVAIACWVGFNHLDKLPVFMAPGLGLTPIKIVMELGLISICAACMAFVWLQRSNNTFFDPASLLIALYLTILSELCFTLYADVADAFNIMGHVYKVLSYGFLYHALVAGSVKLPYTLLAESQGVLQQLTDNIRQVFWMTSPDKKKLIFISPAYESIWGRSCASLLAAPQSWMESIHPDDRQRVTAAVKNQLDGSYFVEYRIRRPDGSERWIRDRAFPIPSAKGDVQRITGVAEDITERRALADQLQQSQRDLESILNHMPALISYWDRNMHNRFGNSAYCDWFGADPGTMPGMHIREVLGEEIYRQTLPHIEAVLRGEPQIFERIISMPNGQQQHSLAHYIPDTINGETLGFYVLVTDISQLKLAETEREKLHTQLLQSQKMESLGQLTGGIAHDFNNMLGAMLGYTELSREMLARPGGAEKIRGYLDEVMAAGMRAKELISQMLVFSRLGTGQQNTQVPVTLILPAVRETMLMLRALIPSTIDLRYQTEDENLAAQIQPVHLHQIILNLVLNARDAIGEYGQIDVNLSRRAVSGNCDACHETFNGDFVEIAVRDTGAGIPENLLANIFDPFFTTKETGKGSGMGLPVVHGIVHALSGHITVDSSAGRGTTVRILLPVSAGAP